MRARRREESQRGVLGRIRFGPPFIEVYFDSSGEPRQRFTLAHELGHLLLDHGRYLRAERVDERDLDEYADAPIGIDSLRHLEWQANCYASCLLLPRESFVASAFREAARMGLQDRGHGLVFVDDQPVNVHNYYAFTNALVAEYGVSRAAVNIRLKGLGLLNDRRAAEIQARPFALPASANSWKPDTTTLFPGF